MTKNEHIVCVIKVLHILLKAKFSDMVSAAYLIVMQMVVTVQLSHSLLSDIIELMLKVSRVIVFS